MKPQQPQSCSECDTATTLGRRDFIKTAAGAVLAGAAAPVLLGGRIVQGAPAVTSPAETAVTRFYQSLSEQQKSAIVFPFEHDLRQKINANWQITKPKLEDDFFTDSQRALVQEIVRGVTSTDGYERIKKQTDDDSGGFGAYSVAVFGTPGSGKFEWELTGRHLTLRADGNSVDQAAFGGPIIYGHGVESSPQDNLFYYQTKKVNEVFKALDANQAKLALVKDAPSESAVTLQGSAGKFPGISIGALSGDQKQLVESTLKVLLAPYRQADVDEVFEILKAGGGLEKLHLAFYQQDDLLGDKVWDIWRVEGPSFVWHFRGAPHVHAYINIGVKTG